MQNKYVLIADGTTDWRIVLGSEASLSEKYAADELQKYIHEISGVRLPIAMDIDKLSKHEIIIGDNLHRALIADKTDLSGLGDDGFVIRMTGDYLIIAGGKRRGTLYGVYSFLEQYLGCRWFSSKVSSIPQKRIVVRTV